MTDRAAASRSAVRSQQVLLSICAESTPLRTAIAVSANKCLAVIRWNGRVNEIADCCSLLFVTRSNKPRGSGVSLQCTGYSIKTTQSRFKLSTRSSATEKWPGDALCRLQKRRIKQLSCLRDSGVKTCWQCLVSCRRLYYWNIAASLNGTTAVGAFEVQVQNVNLFTGWFKKWTHLFHSYGVNNNKYARNMVVLNINQVVLLI